MTARRISQSLERPKGCQEFLDRLDEAVDQAGVRDAANVSVPGFPYLRTNRFLSALGKNLRDEGGKEEWVRWMQNLDLESRKKEIANLSENRILSLGFQRREALMERVSICSFELLRHDRTRPDFFAILEPLVKVPDEYSTLMRTLGLYPLFSLPVAMVTDDSRKKIRARFETPLDKLPVDGQFKTYSPQGPSFLSPNEIEKIMIGSRKNPLGIPLPGRDQERRLAENFAPAFLQDVAASYDRIGELVWRRGRIQVNAERPVVYYYLSHAFLKGEPILQINYVIWYSERAGDNPPSIEKGRLDGMTIRVSLDAPGRVFSVDVVNDCGCYHLFAPVQGRVERVLSRPLMFDPFIPQWLPTIGPGERLGIRVNSGWHQVQRLVSWQGASEAIPYELVPYDILEALPLEGGATESIFDARGIAKGSERVERFILFSMGIPSIGSMRQRGHHAIELIGRVHFDDPFLFDHHFVFK